MEKYDFPQEAALEIVAINHLLRQSNELSEKYFNTLQNTSLDDLEFLGDIINSLNSEDKKEVTRKIRKMIQEGIDQSKIKQDIKKFIKEKGYDLLN